MLVEIALLAPDGHAFDVIWRYVAIGAVAPVGVTRQLGEDGAMGGLTYRTITAQRPDPATTDPADDD